MSDLAPVGLYLFDDDKARAFRPFSLTRPVGELRFGALLQRERAERLVGAPCLGHLCGDLLEGWDEVGAPPAVALDEVDGTRTTVVISSRAVLEAPLPSPPTPATLTIDGEVVGWVLPPGERPPAEALSAPTAWAGPETTIELSGRVLGHVWDFMDGNAAQLCEDIPGHFPEGRFVLPPGVHAEGAEQISIGQNVHIEPGVLLDARHGPIRVEDGVTLSASARLEGPAYIGHGSTIVGGSFASISVGPACKLRGEVDTSVLLGYTNKAHDGFLGHAYVGSWVNLGAGTTNSDLKNTYGSIRVWTPEGPVDTGLVKVGCFLGDHVKTGIGTLLNSGTVVGAGSSVFGGGMQAARIPPFSWGSGDELTTYRLDKFLATAEAAMARRSVQLTPGLRAVLTRAWETTREEQGEEPSR